jgi:hypothetical protein
MGFNFVTEPTEHEKQIINLKKQITELEGKVAKMDEFLELIGKAHIYDMWLTDGKMPETKTENYVDYEDLTYDDVASLEDEK